LITVSDVELRAGARLLLDGVSFRVQPGDRIGLVGRNGAGKTTLTRTLAKQTLPAAGTITHTAPVGYLPQDPRTGDLDVLARDRVLSARGLDEIMRSLEKSQVQLAEQPDDASVLERYGRLEERFTALGGYAAEAEAARICSNLGLPERALGQQLGTLSGGQRRRIELARILFSDATTLLLDEPTNHLDADSITWLRGFLSKHSGGLIVISHDVELLEAVVNKVFHLDANRAALDQYNVGWKTYLAQRETDEKRRKRERVNAEKQAGVLNAQAEKMRAKATKAKAAQGMFKRAEKLLAGVEGERVQDRVAKLRFPEPAPCGRTPLTAQGLSKSYGSLEIFMDVDLAIDRGARVVVLGLNGAGKTTLLRVLSGTEPPDTGAVLPGTACGWATTRRSTTRSTPTARCSRTCARAARTCRDRGPPGARLVPVQRRRRAPAGGTLSGGEKTRLALATLVVSGANVLLLDEPTNNLDPASREEVLGALASYKGAVVLVTHDEGAVLALQPEKVLLLPDGVEDQWSDDFADLVALA
jgi:ATPase subunit of ABC transporter with duplicated ATPase domains